MAILKVTITDSLLDRVLTLLDQFKGKGLEIERLDSGFEAHKQHVQAQLERMDSGKAKYISLDELDQKLEQTIRKYEDQHP